MAKRLPKPQHKTSPDGSKHVYLLVPPVLYDWLWNGTQAGEFKNMQEKIVAVLRTAREAEHQEKPQSLVA